MARRLRNSEAMYVFLRSLNGHYGLVGIDASLNSNWELRGDSKFLS
jgi:hypothetical protein